MAGVFNRATFGLVVFALAWNSLARPFFRWRLGFGRKLDTFNQSCVKYTDLAGCEDIYLHSPSQTLYLACAPPSSRFHWLPAVDNLNASARPSHPDETFLAALPLTSLSLPPQSSLSGVARTEAKVSYSKLPLSGLESSYGPHGLDVWRELAEGGRGTETLRFFLVDHQPRKDGLDAVHGADSVVRLVETEAGSSSTKLLHTFQHPLIRTPNDVAALGPDSFLVTNDKKRKTPRLRRLLEDVFLNSPSDVVYCERSPSDGATRCNVAIDGISEPNGIAKGPGSIVYVAQTATGTISVCEFDGSTKTLKKVESIAIPGFMPVDNLVMDPDGNGDFYAATFPRFYRFLYSVATKNLDTLVPTTIWHISNATLEQRQKGQKWSVEKIFESDGKVASGVTVAVREPRSNSLFLHGILSKSLTVCAL